LTLPCATDGAKGEIVLCTATGAIFSRRMATPRFEVFRDLPDATAEKIISVLPSQNYQTGDVLLRENQPNTRVHLVERGELEVWKGDPHTPHGVLLMTLKPGNCFGEMSAINGAPATACIVAATPATVRSMGLDDLPTEGDVREQVTLNLARTLVDRLSNSTASLQAKHASELKAMQVVASASAFLTRILIALSFYMFSLPGIAFLTPLLPSNSLVSFFIIAAFLWLAVNYMKGRREIVRDYIFMTLDRWPRQIGRGLVWAVPLLGVYVVVKLLIMRAHPGEYRFWDPMSAFSRDHPPGFPLWATYAAVYAFLSFAQEFIRCAVQGTLDMVNPKHTVSKHWMSIVVADVVFTSIHMHLGGLFALQAAIGGLFFGCVFWRERSYLAAAVAHAAVGVWAVFIVGVPAS
jgi:CRP-like cAMP-binding protein